MALMPPDLDDRTFQDIVDEAKQRIPAYIDGWTDHNVSDPGVTFIELFAWMTEIILYRQNQLPDWLTVKMMQLFGIQLDEAGAAQTAVTFQLAAPLPPQEATFTIKAGTEVATTQTETQPSIIFSTDRSLTIYPAKPNRILLKRQEAEKPIKPIDVTNQPTIGSLFSQKPQPDDAIYFGFAEDLSHHLLHFYFECELTRGASGIDTRRPPYIWEGASRHKSSGELQWTAVRLHRLEDETLGLLQPGRMMVHLPLLQQVKLDELHSEPLHWVRLRVLHKHEYATHLLDYKDVREFSQSPKVNSLRVDSMGVSVPVSHAEIVKDEFLGFSDGTPGQRFWLQAAPILRLDSNQSNQRETLCVKPANEANGAKTEEKYWTFATDFGHLASDASPKKKLEFAERDIFVLDTDSGEVRLPPALTDSHGNVQLYGEIPPRGASLWFTHYRHGGGAVGNVPAYALNTLKTTIPGIDRVYNREAASGGQDQEPLETAKLRAPDLLHAQNRAVTAADYEYLASRANVAVGRVKCLQHEPGWVESVDPGTVYLFVLPEVKKEGDSYTWPLTRQVLSLPNADQRKIKDYLDKRRLLTARLQVAQPEIIWLHVELTCKVHYAINKKDVEKEVKDRLYKYLNPLNGYGPEKKGWPFGRDLYTYDVYTCLQGMAEVLAVPTITLFRVTSDSRERLENNTLIIPPHAVLALASCVVMVVDVQ